MGIIGRCGNINGRRSCNLCSHSTAALLYFNKIVRKEIINDPTPMVTKRLKNIKHPGMFVDQMREMDHHQVTNYLNDTIINENFEDPNDPMYFQHVYEIDNVSSCNENEFNNNNNNDDDDDDDSVDIN